MTPGRSPHARGAVRATSTPKLRRTPKSWSRSTGFSEAQLNDFFATLDVGNDPTKIRDEAKGHGPDCLPGHFKKAGYQTTITSAFARTSAIPRQGA